MTPRRRLGNVLSTILNEELNCILLDLSDIAWANGSIDAAAQRQLAEGIAEHLGNAKQIILERMAEWEVLS